MIRDLVRVVLFIVLVVVVIAALGAFFLGYRVGGHRVGSERRVVGTSGRSLDTSAARERGAEIGEKVASAAAVVGDALSDGSITAKVKSKLALDDTVKSRDISVSTSDGVVTLSGKVGSAAERSRAVQLTRETDGVKSVTDKIEVTSK